MVARSVDMLVNPQILFFASKNLISKFGETFGCSQAVRGSCRKMHHQYSCRDCTVLTDATLTEEAFLRHHFRYDSLHELPAVETSNDFHLKQQIQRLPVHFNH